MNLTQLAVLAAVARHQSVTEAAKELHYTQPAVSHHLARLEATTNAKLIQRIGRGIRLTPEGKLLATAPPRSSAASTPPRPNWPRRSGCAPGESGWPGSNRS